MKLRAIASGGLLALSAMLMASAATYAQERIFGPVPQDQRGQQDAQQRAERGMPPRDMRDAERGRMNPEERRQLRRDIQDAGREIYRPAHQGQRRGEQRREGRR